MQSGLRLLNCLCFAALLGCGSVGPSMDSAEGDGERDRALAIFVDHSRTDRIEPSKGDQTDWSYVDVVDQGRLKLTVSIDSPERLEAGEVEFFDEFGNQLSQTRIEDNQTLYVFTTEVKKVPNKFFVRVFAKGGGSPYTLGAAVDLPPPPPEPVVVAAPPPPPPQEPIVPRAKPARPPTTGPVVRPPPPPTAPPVAAASLSGRVIRVQPSEDNTQVTIFIRLDEGAAVSKGARGVLSLKDGDVPIVLTSVTNRNATAVVKQPPHKFTGNLTVKISAN
ncbi:MAG: hypothetical protein ACOYM9_02300 [Bradymonadia bacterium]